MRLRTIGTGTIAPTPDRVCSAHLVEVDDVMLLMDCGHGVLHRMATLDLPWQEITHVALTHFHADHIGDLVALISAWRYGTLPPRSEPIELLGPPGTIELMGKLAAVFGDWVLEPGTYQVNIRELSTDDRMELADGVILTAFPVPHTDESVAYSVVGGGRRLVYTGDTSFDAELGAWAEGCDLLLAECSLPAAMAVPSHLTPEECGTLAALVQPAHLVLTHFYPPVEHVDVAAIVAERFDGRTTLSTDGWSTEL